MPRLMTFLACEKVINSEDAGSTSLIGILQGFTIPVQPPPDKAVLPISLAVYALWEREPDDKAGQLLQKIQLIAPDKSTVLIESPENPVIKTVATRFHRLTLNIQGVPILGDGDHMFFLLTRPSDSETFSQRAFFPMPLTVVTPNAT